jgi:hypothetical protein
MSGEIKVPPRPKPGRKPIKTEGDVDRRRIQNRLAQRNFRDKRQQKLADTQHELQLQKEHYEEELGELRRTVDDLSRENKRLQNDLNTALAQLSAISPGNQQVPMMQLPNPRRRPLITGPPIGPGSDLTTPPHDRFPQEVDFTEMYGRPQRRQRLLSGTMTGAARPSIADSTRMDFVEEMDDDDELKCGFCTDDGNCQCKQKEVPMDIEAGPGSCNACQQDPERAAACRKVAMQAQGPSASLTTQSTMTCSTFMDRVGGGPERLASLAERLGKELQVLPSAHAGFEVDEHEAAEALQSLAAAPGPKSTRRTKKWVTDTTYAGTRL